MFLFFARRLGIHYLVDVGVQVADKSVDLRHHSVPWNVPFFLACLQVAPKISHHVNARFQDS